LASRFFHNKLVQIWLCIWLSLNIAGAIKKGPRWPNKYTSDSEYSLTKTIHMTRWLRKCPSFYSTNICQMSD